MLDSILKICWYCKWLCSEHTSAGQIPARSAPIARHWGISLLVKPNQIYEKGIKQVQSGYPARPTGLFDGKAKLEPAFTSWRVIKPEVNPCSFINFSKHCACINECFKLIMWLIILSSLSSLLNAHHPVALKQWGAFNHQVPKNSPY